MPSLESAPNHAQRHDNYPLFYFARNEQMRRPHTDFSARWESDHKFDREERCSSAITRSAAKQRQLGPARAFGSTPPQSWSKRALPIKSPEAESQTRPCLAEPVYKVWTAQMPLSVPGS